MDSTQAESAPERNGSGDGWLDLEPGWLFASIRDAVVVTDAETNRIVLWNPAAVELLGFQSADVLGRPLPEAS